ncbi:MAG: hypothetical protein HY703_00510, partial [Gemmatimonadetes bacterium]|nr:hypothetical protein [Gemmatimonadota bacterium]
NYAAAMSALEQSLRSRSGSMVYLDVEPLLDPLRGDPRFERLRRMAGRSAE